MRFCYVWPCEYVVLMVFVRSTDRVVRRWEIPADFVVLWLAVLSEVVDSDSAVVRAAVKEYEGCHLPVRARTHGRVVGTRS